MGICAVWDDRGLRMWNANGMGRQGVSLEATADSSAAQTFLFES